MTFSNEGQDRDRRAATVRQASALHRFQESGIELLDSERSFLKVPVRKRRKVSRGRSSDPASRATGQRPSESRFFAAGANGMQVAHAGRLVCREDALSLSAYRGRVVGRRECLRSSRLPPNRHFPDQYLAFFRFLSTIGRCQKGHIRMQKRPYHLNVKNWLTIG
jgi:hypothetical protein